MKRIVLFVFLCASAVGCGALHADYVRADRETFTALAPVVSRLLTHESDSDKQKDVEGLMESWDARLDEAEKLIKEQGS